jgi:multiple antibiotic resistance protein
MIGPAELFMIFFVMLGPLKLLGPFVARTLVMACAAIVIGGLLGRSMLTNWRVSIPALRLTGGIIFFLVALRQLLEQYQPAPAADPEPLPASPFAAASELVFPMVLTPYGVAAVIALLAASPDTTRTATILGLVLLVMLFNLGAMWVARRILVGFAIVVLQILGAVLAVLQVALSVQIIVDALRSLGIGVR